MIFLLDSIQMVIFLETQINMNDQNFFHILFNLWFNLSSSSLFCPSSLFDGFSVVSTSFSCSLSHHVVFVYQIEQIYCLTPRLHCLCYIVSIFMKRDVFEYLVLYNTILFCFFIRAMFDFYFILNSSSIRYKRWDEVFLRICSRLVIKLL